MSKSMVTQDKVKSQEMQSKHFVLVHGMCLGAWCWYKLKPLLESLGHKVTALDMGACGINRKPIEEIRTFEDYNEPLISFMASLPVEEKVVLVGHSLGGFNIAFAMEKFPEMISAAVFLAAFVPDTVNNPSYFPDKIFTTSENEWLDCTFSTNGSPDAPVVVVTFGHEFMSSILYGLSPIEDYELAKMLVRPIPVLIGALAKAEKFTEGRYGSVRRVSVICKEDKIIPHEFIREMIECNGLKEVKVIEGADHMGMISKPQELCDCLVQIFAVENP